MPIAYLNIGSNQGDSYSAIERAVALIELNCHTKATLSDYVRSEPWGFESEHEFLNIGIAVRWDGSPEELLDTLQAIERTISPLPHRKADGSYADRLIDIDIIDIDEMVYDSERLTLPHPRMHLRRFVLQPLAQIAPGWRHPMSGLTALQQLERL